VILIRNREHADYPPDKDDAYAPKYQQTLSLREPARVWAKAVEFMTARERSDEPRKRLSGRDAAVSSNSRRKRLILG
jgi:hypothetical protein